MKTTHFCLLLFLIVGGSANAAAIVSNSATPATSEDSVAFSFFNLDSTGQNISGLDTTWIVVSNPSGTVCFSEKLTGVAGRVTRQAFNGDTSFIWQAQVADIDGAGAAGLYNVTIVAGSDATGGWLKTPSRSSFQIVDWKLDEMGENTFSALDSLSRALDSLCTAMDSLYAALDSLQSQDGWIATVSNQTNLLGNQASLSVDLTAVRSDLDGIEDTTNTTLDVIRNQPDSTSLYAADMEALAGLTADSVVADSLCYRGYGTDSSSIARFVWNTPQAGHTVSGTFGRFLDARVSGVGSGGGQYPVGITVVDTVDQQVVPYVNMTIRNLEQTALIAAGRGGADGRLTLSLDADSFVVSSSSVGYVFAACDTLVVDGPANDTVPCYRLTPGTPSSPSLCRVYGYLYDLSGSPMENAVVTALLPAGVRQAGAIVVSPFSVVTETDDNGRFALDLIPSNLLQPTGTAYEITLRTPAGTVLRKRLEIPDAAFWRLKW